MHPGCMHAASLARMRAQQPFKTGPHDQPQQQQQHKSAAWGVGRQQHSSSLRGHTRMQTKHAAVRDYTPSAHSRLLLAGGSLSPLHTPCLPPPAPPLRQLHHPHHTPATNPDRCPSVKRRPRRPSRRPRTRSWGRLRWVAVSPCLYLDAWVPPPCLGPCTTQPTCPGLTSLSLHPHPTCRALRPSRLMARPASQQWPPSRSNKPCLMMEGERVQAY